MPHSKSKAYSTTPRFVAAVLCLVELLGMSLWFTASAVTPQLQAHWGLDATAAGWLTTIVQLGFVAGTAIAALLNLSDLWPARWFVASSCVLAALANALVGADSYGFALGMRFLTGFFLAGVYPPGMKMMATWFESNRGLAIGALVGALTIGKALPYLIRAFHHVGVSFVVLSASGAALCGAALVLLFYRDGPHHFERRPFSWGLIGTVLRHRETRLAIAGYLGHMWELYAMWSLIAVFFYDYFMVSASARASSYSGIAAFGVIAAGAVGSVLAGKWADHIGRERVTIWSMLVSGTCALLMGWVFYYHLPLALTLALALIWGFAVVADSAQFSAIVTEVAPRHAVGTALTLQTCLGFLLTAFTIWFAIRLHAEYDWRAAFGMLAIGPVLGIAAMLRLAVLRRKNAGAIDLDVLRAD